MSAAAEKKALDTTVLDLRGIASFTDFFVITTGANRRQVQAISDEVVEQLKPKKYIIPMHYGTRVFEDLLPPDEFLEDQKSVKKYSGNRLEVESDFSPKEPVVVLLNWK